MGFCVARTKNGRGSWCVSPMTVTRCSCMASRSADCVFGEALLISSASMMLVKSGPGWNLNSLRPSTSWSTGLPVMSPGRRSGVNWILLVLRPRDFERPLTSSVLPSPGSPSRRMWPLARSPVMTRSMSCSCPKRT